MKHTVALIPLSTYEQSAVDAAVRQGVTLLGGIGQFVKPEEKIVLKPNLLARALPQKAITTHPAVFSSVCRLLREEGYDHLSYGDSPGSPTTTPDKAAESAGIAEAAAEGATMRMRAFLIDQVKMAEHEAGMLLSLMGDLRICQAVDPQKTCRMELPLMLLDKCGYQFP